MIVLPTEGQTMSIAEEQCPQDFKGVSVLLKDT